MEENPVTRTFRSKKKVKAESIDTNSNEPLSELKTQLSFMPFEELRSLQQQVGSKVFNETVFGANSKQSKITVDENFSVNYLQLDLAEFRKQLKCMSKKDLQSIKTNLNQDINKSSKQYKANKSFPREMSSKVLPKKELRNYQLKKSKVEIRDPRFDIRTGVFDKKEFDKNYKFLNYKKKEDLESYKNILKKGNVDDDKREELKTDMIRIKNDVKQWEWRKKKHMEKHKNAESIINKLHKGEKVRFKKKSEQRLENLMGQYKELKNKNRLKGHIQKLNRKKAIKQKLTD